MRITLLDILKVSGAAVSTSRGRRLVLQGAIWVNDMPLERLDDLNMTILPDDEITVGSRTINVHECFEKLERDEIPTDTDGPTNPR